MPPSPCYRVPACFLLLLSAALAACGGGGGGGTAAPNPPPPVEPTTATLTTPANLADNLSGTVTLLATASGPVASVEFQVDGAAVGSDTTAPYSATVNAANYVGGQHIVRARARDAAGNASAWSTARVRFTSSALQPAGFTRSVINGLTNATALAATPDGRLLVAQQGGALRVVKNGALLATPFLQLTVDSTGERGLIGVAVDPAFASNGYVYVHYTTTAGGTHNRVSRFVASGDVATGIETVLLDLPTLSSATNHNGGGLHVGPDGKLYIGVGENGNGAQAPDLTLPFGKLLRINTDGSIPSDNPFVGGFNEGRVWAYGLRNPFTFAFRPQDGRLHINDVGAFDWEEVNLGARGANYGWPATEGPTTASGVTAPLFAYPHAMPTPAGSGPGGFFTGCSVVGAAFYPDSGAFPAHLRGNYFFADLCEPAVAVMDLANDATVYAFASVTGNTVDLAIGSDGALWVLGRTLLTRIAAP